MPSPRRIALAFLATLVLLGGAGTAAAQSSDLPKPDPAPAAVKQTSTPKPQPSSGGGSSSSSSPSPAPSYTPAPVVSSTPSSSSASTQSSSTASTATPTKSQVTRAAKAKAAKARAAKARAAKARAAKAKAAKARAAEAKRAAAKAKKPVVLAPVRSAPAHAFTPPAADTSSHDSGLSLSDRGVLLVTFLLGLAVGAVVLLGRAAWRRSSWRWRYRGLLPRRRSRDAEPELASENVPDALRWWLGDYEANGSNGAEKDDAEAVPVTQQSRADAPSGT